MKKSRFPLFLLALSAAALSALASCDTSTGLYSSASEDDISFSALTDTSDWSEATHEKLDTEDIVTNLDKIFDTSSVQEIRIVIEPDNWELMNANLEDLSDELGNSTDFNTVDNPFFVPCEFFYEDTEWYKVGIRFKGNSSLYNANCSKLPFKLDFDEFEDEYPEIDNQRFYGFKQLNLKSNYLDESEMHEVVAGDLFLDFGLVGAHSSFYALYLNVDGSDDGDIYYGLYTLVEEVDDTVIKTQYDDDSGNLYKPEDDAATFAAGTYNEDEYDLKTDDDDSYNDIENFYIILNDSTRTSDPDSWQANLESVFDVDIFLKWLAANSVMQNWDTYGVMDHNFFLYNNPATDKFEWIPWDNNEALEDNNRCLSLTMSSVDDDWPLISYILDVDSYKSIYKTYVDDFADELFNETYMDPIYTGYEVLIETYVEDEGNDYTFTSSWEFSNAVDDLMDHTEDRNSAANTYAGID